MRKTMMAVALILAIAAAAGWNQTVEEMDGFDWVAMSRAEKGRVIQGYWLSEIVMVMAMKFDVAENQILSDEQKLAQYAEIDEKFQTPGTVGDMIDEIDRSYSRYETREISLWLALGFVSHPTWFESKEKKVAR